MALKASRPSAVATNPGTPAGVNTGAVAGATTPTPAVTASNATATNPNPTQTPNVPAVQGSTAVGTPAKPGSIQDMNAGILDNIENLGASGNFVTMDGSDFLYKATETTVRDIDLQVNYGKRYYQWVEEIGDSKNFHNSDNKLDDRYKLRFEIHWAEENEEGEVTEFQFHMPTASAMRFIDYVKALAQAGYGIGQVVTRMSISRQVQKGTTNKYSRAEFTMVGIADAEGGWTEVANGITTVGKK